MKKIFYIILAAVAITACDNDFLTRRPETDLAPESFFTSAAELELWSNRYYEQFKAPDDYLKMYADDYVGSSLNGIGKGTRTPESESWGSAWRQLRWINLQFERDENCADKAVRNKYRGIAYFFRANFYFDKVRKYGDVPFYDYVISDSDWESLKKARDSRGYVMFQVMKDLDSAIVYLPAKWESDATYRVAGNAALALKARAALFEGTFRKYHKVADESIDGVNVSADWFLKQAADAAGKIIEKGGYSLFTNSIFEDTKENVGPYRCLFIQEDAPANEYILASRFNTELLVRHPLQFALMANARIAATQRFVNHYLMADGSKVQDQANFGQMTYKESFVNRDPRMAQTLLAPGYKQIGEQDETIETLSNNQGGYSIIKYISSAQNNTASSSTTDFPLFRYAEVLLNYAEAKAELGTLTQEDIDKTVNVIRARVGMKALSLAEANGTPDALLQKYYPNVTASDMTGAILEIRRERTVELVGEGHRQWDLIRWKEGKFLTPNAYEANGFEGMYFPGLGEYDMNGDGEMDVVIYTGKKPSGSLAAYNVDGAKYKLSEGDKGYLLMYYQEKYVWNEERDYLWPIPQDQIIATNKILTQNPGY